MLFEYVALQKDSTKVKGVIEANSVKDLTDYLKKNGLFPIEITEKKDNTVSKFTTKLLNKASFKDIVYITRQLAIMLDSGLTLISSLEIIKKQTSKAALKEMLSDMDKYIREGKTFSMALSNFPKQFSNFYIALVKSGEASGKLDSTLNRLAIHLERERALRQSVRNAMIYPLAIVSAMFLLIFVMFAFVMPRMLSLYDNFDVELPESTKLLMLLTDFTEKYWIFILGSVVGAVFLLLRYIKSSTGKKIFDKFIFNVPVIGNVVKISGLVNVTRTLSILISSGVPILDSLRIVTNVNNNVVFKKAFIEISERVEKGMSVGNAMSKEAIFPESLIQMTIVGEQTGKLDVSLQKISDYYEQESEMAIKGLLTLMEPAIIVLLSVVVGFLVMAVITPIFSLTSSLQ